MPGASQSPLANQISNTSPPYRLPPDVDDPSWNAVRAFLRSFHASILCYIPDAESEKHLGVIHSDVLDIEKQQQGYGVFYSVNGFKSISSRTESNLLSLNACYVDIDYPKDLHGAPTAEELAAFKADKLETLSSLSFEGLAPTYITQTKNGYHALWCFDEPIVLDNLDDDARAEILHLYRETLNAIITRLGGDTGAADLTRVLRLPNTWHQKDPRHPFLTSIVFASSENLYTLDSLHSQFAKDDGATPHHASLDALGLEKLLWKNATGRKIPAEAWKKLEEKFPFIERDSYKELLKKSGHEEDGRKRRLIIAISGMKMAGKTESECLAYFDAYNGLPLNLIQRTIRSAYASPTTYAYGWNNLTLAPFVTEEERTKAKAYLKIICDDLNKEERQDLKETFSPPPDANKAAATALYERFERVICQENPHLRYCDDDTFYTYANGVYTQKSFKDVESLFYRSMEEHNLLKFRTKTSVASKMACLQSLPEIRLRQDDMNGNPDILNLRNGLLNIKTMEFMPHTPNYFSTIQINASYREKPIEELAPRWLRFVDEIMDGRRDMVRFLQQMAGYCMTKSTEYQCAFIFLGSGANGKSTFSEVLQDLIGLENVSNISLDLLQKEYGVAGLYGKTLNVVEEINNHYFESANIKLIISGERVTGNRKYTSPLTFRPYAKLLFAVNALPKSNDSSLGWYRRFHIITFPRQFDTTTGAGLRATLKTEMDGILLWALQGWQDCLRHGLVIPEAVRREADRFKELNSPVVEFLLQECTISQAAPSRSVDEVFRKYRAFAQDNGYGTKSRTSFIKELETLSHPDLRVVGVDHARGDNRVRGIMSFKDEPSSPNVGRPFYA